MTTSDPIGNALQLPSGGRFYKCALQVNPFAYLTRHSKATAFEDETAYNEAVVQACHQQGIEVIAVTDHYRADTARGLWEAGTQAGLRVFPGFEAVTKEGVHLLCLFDPECPIEQIERYIGDCGVHDRDDESPTGEYDAVSLLRRDHEAWGGVCVAAHVAADQGGLLKVLRGQSRINVWKSPYLLACSLPGTVEDAPDDLRPILQNKNSDYSRPHPIAVLNAQDVNGPEDLSKPGSYCWIKMSDVSVEGLRQAFLDPESRVRLATDPEPEEHAELVAIAWDGGFLDEQAIHFNENLNVLIGGRGTGKSTVVESIRYVLDLDPLGEEARQAHEGIVRHVLKSGTTISALVRCYRPSKSEYRIERTVPNPPTVRDQDGRLVNLTPADVIPRVEVYGQHEIAELTKSPEKLTQLLDRFVEPDQRLAFRKTELRRELERSRSRLTELRSEIFEIEEQLAALPALQETLRRFQEAGVEERLKEQSLLVREERVLKAASERVEPFREYLDGLRRELPIDRAFLSSRSLAELPGKDALSPLNSLLKQLNTRLTTITRQLVKALDEADGGIQDTSERWQERKEAVNAAYNRLLRELQKSSVNGEEFIRLRRQIEELQPLRERQKILLRDLEELDQRRRALLAEWEDVKATQFRQLQRAARKVSRQLTSSVRVQVEFERDREPLFALLREQIGGRLSEAIDALRTRQGLSLTDFVQALQEGGDAVRVEFSIPKTQADRLAEPNPGVFMLIEESDLPHATRIELNVAGEDQGPVWRQLEELSTGQKATAVLLLLLLESDAPLIIDQPEDDLDNRFVTEGVVPKMREEKRRRQFVFTTHNANIPVLGDAELIVGLKASGEADAGFAQMPADTMGSIDARPVRELVEEILEGGKAAFEMRRLKYGF